MKTRILTGLLLIAWGVGIGAGCGRTATPSAEFRKLDSALIYSVRYFTDTSTLAVLMQDGKGHDYKQVPQEIYRDLLRSKTPDTFFQEQIEGRYNAKPWDL